MSVVDGSSAAERREPLVNFGCAHARLSRTLYTMAGICGAIALLVTLSLFAKSGLSTAMFIEFALVFIYASLIVGVWKRKPVLIKWFIWTYIIHCIFDFVLEKPVIIGDMFMKLAYEKGSVSSDDQLHVKKAQQHVIELLSLYGIFMSMSVLIEGALCWLALRAFRNLSKERVFPSGWDFQLLLNSPEPSVTEQREPLVNFGCTRVRLSHTLYIWAGIGAAFALLYTFAQFAVNGLSIDAIIMLLLVFIYASLFVGVWKQSSGLIKWFIWSFILHCVYDFIFVYPSGMGDEFMKLVHDKGSVSSNDQLQVEKAREHIIYLLVIYGIVISLAVLIEGALCWLALRAYRNLTKENLFPSGWDVQLLFNSPEPSVAETNVV